MQATLSKTTAVECRADMLSCVRHALNKLVEKLPENSIDALRAAVSVVKVEEEMQRNPLLTTGRSLECF